MKSDKNEILNNKVVCAKQTMNRLDNIQRHKLVQSYSALSQTLIETYNRWLVIIKTNNYTLKIDYK